MLLYDKDDPLAVLDLLAPDIRSVHLKDANRPRVKGTWGEEVPLGLGQTNTRAFVKALKRIGFRGALCIEREVGTQAEPSTSNTVCAFCGMSRGGVVSAFSWCVVISRGDSWPGGTCLPWRTPDVTRLLDYRPAARSSLSFSQSVESRFPRSTRPIRNIRGVRAMSSAHRSGGHGSV